MPSYYESFDYFCQMELQCEDGYTWAFCQDYGDGQTHCNCEGQNGSNELLIEGVPLSDACSFAANECVSPTTPPDPEDLMCEIVSESLGRGYCYIERECSYALASSGGVSVDVVKRNGTDCNQNGDNWDCGCWGNGRSLDIGFTFQNVEARDVCSTALDICDEGIAEVDGPAECELEHLYASRYDCYLEQQCRRSGTTASGIEVYSREWLSTNCYQGDAFPGVDQPDGGVFLPLQDAETTWWCECGGQLPEASGFELQGSDSWDICQEASAACVDQLNSP